MRRNLLLTAALAAALLASTAVYAEQLQTCTEVQAYCMRLCNGSTTPAPATWSCEANRCSGLAECLSTGTYRIGTQYGHRPPSRTTFGPYEKK